MKTSLFRYRVFMVILGLFIITPAQSQEADIDNYRMRFRFKTIKQHDNSRVFEASFIAANKKDRKDRVPVYDAEIKFYNVSEEDEVLLGASKTSNEGVARITVPETHEYLLDSEGKINLKAIFEGSDGLDSEEEELGIRDLNLELELIEIDSVKTAIVKAFTLDSLGVAIPVEEAEVFISIGGMLSKMKVNEGTIENGEYEFEMPADIPGDINGNLEVYSSIEDHDEFGDVIQKKTINWGIFNKQIKRENNTLWSEAAPIWMYAVLTILLVGVWANYVYTIINLFKIKKEGTELALKTESD
ncbi:MAG: hypothetical protein KJP26_15495 [Maribacter sp.]|nr:hypothetical protein [Maribacter sp.]NNK18200.1 hypothetical protein [Maribacter sp.]